MTKKDITRFRDAIGQGETKGRFCCLEQRGMCLVLQEDKGTVLLSHLDKRDKRYVPNITKGKCAKIGTSPIFTVPNIHDIWYAEEIKTMGINYTSISGEVMQNYSTYNGIISENGLRMENGLNQRVSYIGVWY